MDIFLPFVLKSLVISALTLGVLAIARSRSAAERSWIAHFGLLALLLLPLAGSVLPQLHVQVPAFMASTTVPQASTVSTSAEESAAAVRSPARVASADGEGRPIDWLPLLYGLPALALLGLTLLALLRLFALRARAEVLVEPTWLSALAHAQRRMGFKHGTALLTSSDLHSPISWGLMRPVILLNDEALNAGDQAEAIIAHELAHVARLDWAKLMLARIATALFWFNPLVWILAREAHQLREETADDAVLAADIPDTDYAQLLVGVARHECKGLLLGAHGVAPSKGSLKRRVKRVLDGGLPRGPVAGSFAAGVGVGAVMFAAPLAALTFAPRTAPVMSSNMLRAAQQEPPPALPAVVARAVAEASSQSADAVAVALGERPRSPVSAVPPRSPIDRAIDMKAIGVTPDFIADLNRAGFRNLSNSELMQARALGVTADYALEMRAAGYPTITLNQLGVLRALGVTSRDVERFRRAGSPPPSVEKLVEYQALGGRREIVRDCCGNVDIHGPGSQRIRIRNGGRRVDMVGPAGQRIRIRDNRVEEMVGPNGVEPPETPDAPEPPEPPEESDG